MRRVLVMTCCLPISAMAACSRAANPVLLSLEAESASELRCPFRTPESVGAFAVNDPDKFPSQYREALAAVALELRRDGEDPTEYIAAIDGGHDQLTFHLWHTTAFLPENACSIGNPGGRCVDFVYDTKTRAVVAKLGWQ